MKKVAVIYQSKHGTTKQYAQWIAGALNAAPVEASTVKPAQLTEYDIVIYGGWLFAGKISGVKLVTKHTCNALVVFTVGITDPQTTDYTSILAENFTPELLPNIKVFHLRGGIDYRKLGFVQKSMMTMVKKYAEKKSPDEYSSENRAVLETYGETVDFTDISAIAPIVDCVRAM